MYIFLGRNPGTCVSANGIRRGICCFSELYFSYMLNEGIGPALQHPFYLEILWVYVFPFVFSSVRHLSREVCVSFMCDQQLCVGVFFSQWLWMPTCVCVYTSFVPSSLFSSSCCPPFPLPITLWDAWTFLSYVMFSAGGWSQIMVFLVITLMNHRGTAFTKVERLA